MTSHGLLALAIWTARRYDTGHDPSTLPRHVPEAAAPDRDRRIAALLAGALALVLGALRENIVFFYTPSEIPANADGRSIRLGGLVKAGSVEIDGLNSRFVVTDGEAEIAVSFDGALPSLFREVRASLPKAGSRRQPDGQQCSCQT